MPANQCARWPSLLLLLFVGIAQAGAALDTDAQREIDYLLTRLETSDCSFFRNGKWYNPARARQHLEKKLAWLVKRDLVDSAEQFIERAASESSRSGELYLMQCADAPAVPSSEWLTDQLARYRRGGVGN